MRTRIFKSGNSQAVRIPAAIAYEGSNAEFEITRVGDGYLIQPVRRMSMKEVVEELRRLPSSGPLGPIERTRARETIWDKENRRLSRTRR